MVRNENEIWTAGEVGKLARMLSRRSEQLESVLNRVPFGVAAVDSFGILTFANKAFRRLHENLPRLVADVRDRLGAAGADCALRLEGGAMTVYRHEDGGLTLLCRLDEAEVVREQALGALERVSGHMAHRLNNLLTVMLSCTEMLESEYGAIEVIGRELAQIREAAMMASRVTQDLLTYSRGRPVTFTPIEVDRALTNMSNLLARVAGDCELRMQTNAPGAVARLADRDLDSVLLNLVRNSAEAVAGPHGIITVQTWVEGSGIHLSVTDNGPGIAPEVQSFLFEPFVSTKRGSNGMGLAVTYGIVKRAGGDIQIAAVPSGGTRVTVVLPITDALPKTGISIP